MTDFAEIAYEEGVTELADVPYYVVGRNGFFTGLSTTDPRPIYDVFPCATRRRGEAHAKDSTARFGGLVAFCGQTAHDG